MSLPRAQNWHLVELSRHMDLPHRSCWYDLWLSLVVVDSNAGSDCSGLGGEEYCDSLITKACGWSPQTAFGLSRSKEDDIADIAAAWSVEVDFPKGPTVGCCLDFHWFWRRSPDDAWRDRSRSSPLTRSCVWTDGSRKNFVDDSWIPNCIPDSLQCCTSAAGIHFVVDNSLIDARLGYKWTMNAYFGLSEPEYVRARLWFVVVSFCHTKSLS